ncbi:MAG: Zn-dependent exopeptidase M28 [Oscillospiraceae bacterium]|nr:Zn-dependent exopeptidase M28 [Oscillospiraceae bacterium]
MYKWFLFAVILSLIVLLLILSACGRERNDLPFESSPLLHENDEKDSDNVSKGNHDEEWELSLVEKSEDCNEESDPNNNSIGVESILFERIDFDSIDFASMILATSLYGETAYWYVQYISNNLPSRVPFTYREYDTAIWLKKMLLAKGFDDSQVRIQEFSHDDVVGWEDYFGWGIPGLFEAKQQGWHEGHELRSFSQNVILTIPGKSTQTIIIGAHYDSLRYAGTSDNASGVALLMENAHRMLNADNYHTLKYVFFGAHEIGMLGTFYFYDSLTQEECDSILFYINADALLEGPYMLVQAGYGFDLNENSLSKQLIEITNRFSDTYDVSTRFMGVTGGDQLLFLYKGHTTMAFWGIDLSTFTNFLHSPRDSYEIISRRYPEMIKTIMESFSMLLKTILIYEY